ncbi:MAG: hypothetical protein U5L95_04525 [Candidatus Saccharibacteria bacterium]|nr:hypothetical protein [Candidatus Saccharibacteria bacterium]
MIALVSFRIRYKIIAGLSIAVLFAPSVGAQQMTSSTEPDTQNPQNTRSTQTDLVETESGLQDSSDASILHTEGRITVEAGEPRVVETPEPAENTVFWPAIIGAAGVTLIAAVLLLQKNKHVPKAPIPNELPEEKQKSTRASETNDTPEKTTKPEKVKSSKKKKRRAKKRSGKK